MGKKSCAVYGCNSNFGDKEQYVSVFAFPFIPDSGDNREILSILKIERGDTPQIVGKKNLTKNEFLLYQMIKNLWSLMRAMVFALFISNLQT